MSWTSFWLWFDNLLEALVKGDIHEVPPTPPVPPAPVVEAPKPLLNDFCDAIKVYEGWGPGTRSYKNNNPGNCRYSSEGYLASYGVVKKDKNNFAIFKDYATGWRYLNNLVRNKIVHNPQESIYAFFETYAPVTDGNNPIKYAEFVARHIGVPATTPVHILL